MHRHKNHCFRVPALLYFVTQQPNLGSLEQWTWLRGFIKNSLMQQALLPTVWRFEIRFLSFLVQLQLPHFYVCMKKIPRIKCNQNDSNTLNPNQIMHWTQKQETQDVHRQAPVAHLSSTKTQFDGSSFSWRAASRYISDSGFLKPVKKTRKKIWKTIRTAPRKTTLHWASDMTCWKTVLPSTVFWSIYGSLHSILLTM